MSNSRDINSSNYVHRKPIKDRYKRKISDQDLSRSSEVSQDLIVVQLREGKLELVTEGTHLPNEIKPVNSLYNISDGKWHTVDLLLEPEVKC